VVSALSAVGFVIGFLKLAVYFSSLRNLSKIWIAKLSPPVICLVNGIFFYFWKSVMFGGLD